MINLLTKMLCCRVLKAWHLYTHALQDGMGKGRKNKVLKTDSCQENLDRRDNLPADQIVPWLCILLLSKVILDMGPLYHFKENEVHYPLVPRLMLAKIQSPPKSSLPRSPFTASTAPVTHWQILANTLFRKECSECRNNNDNSNPLPAPVWLYPEKRLEAPIIGADLG
jgi:hypothetical protein